MLGVSGDVEIIETQTATEPSSALYVVCEFVGVVQFTVRGHYTPLAAQGKELWTIRQIL